MNDGAHRRLVNPQSKSNRTHHHPNFVRHPFFLVLPSCATLHLPMVTKRGDAIFFQKINSFSHARYRWLEYTMTLPSETCFTARSSNSFCVVAWHCRARQRSFAR